MQLYALNDQNVLISANHAVKQKNYICFECKSSVRLRGGFHRQKHFYHLDLDRSCKLGGKSLLHLQVQCYFQRVLPENDCFLEHRFPKMNRIADVVWPSKKLIFEVQVSGITAEEVRCRNHDYSLMGYQVVWILHDTRFNKFQVSAAEGILRESPHYFTNMDINGSGVIYDQLDWVVQGVRKHREKLLPVDLTQPRRPARPIYHVPQVLDRRLKLWPLSFSGDLITKALDPEYRPVLKKYIAFEVAFKPKLTIKSFISQWLVRPYHILFQILLEKACR
jgi:competence protein CoiA